MTSFDNPTNIESRMFTPLFCESHDCAEPMSFKNGEEDFALFQNSADPAAPCFLWPDM